MREIKFRLWDALGNRMLDWLTCTAHLLQPGTTGDTMFWMQYTGLHDSKGTEIFEGDIVKVWEYKSENGDDTEMIETTHPQKVSWFYALPFPHWTLEDLYLTGLQFVGHFDKLEVIGNIYEGDKE